MQPLLTIAIPTYNRAPCLHLLLEHLAPQLLCQPEVELIISDNASSDGTGEVVKEFQEAGLAVGYVRNVENVGMDGNFLQCFTLAKGRYVWVLGDDDLIIPGALGQVMDLLRGDEYSLVYVSSYSFRGTFVAPSELRAPLQTLTFLTAEALARKVNIFLTFISGNIVNKEALHKADFTSYTELLGSNLLQLGWICGALEGHRKSVFICDAIVAAREDNTGGYGLCRTFGQNLQRITTERLSSPAIRRFILNSSIQKLLPAFLLKTRSGVHAFSSESAHSILQPVFEGNYRYWLFAYPVLALPRRIAGVWLMAIRLVNRIDRVLGLPLLT